jgi:hypothetical protein
MIYVYPKIVGKNKNVAVSSRSFLKNELILSKNLDFLFWSDYSLKTFQKAGLKGL